MPIAETRTNRAAYKFASVKLALLKSAFVRLAFSKIAFRRSVPTSWELLRLAANKRVYYKLALLRLA